MATSLWDEGGSDLFSEQKKPQDATNPFGIGVQPSPTPPQAPATTAAPTPQSPTTPMYTPPTGGFMGGSGNLWDESGWGGGSQVPAGTGGFKTSIRDQMPKEPIGQQAQDSAGQVAAQPQNPQDPVAKDKIARDTYRNLKNAGHDVKWVGQQLQVDGRLYDVGGGSNGAAKVSDWTGAGGLPVMPQSAMSASESGAGPVDNIGVSVPGAAGGLGQYADRLSGFDTTKLNDATHTTPKYVFARIASKYNTQDPAQREALLAELRADPSGYFANASFGGTNGDKLIIGGQPDAAFGGVSQFDVFRNAAGGEYTPQWGVMGAEGAGAGQNPSMAGGLAPGNVLGMSSSAQSAASSLAPAGLAGGQNPSAQEAWEPTAPTYTPGELDQSDIPTFSYESLLADAQNASPVEGQTDQAIADLLANPYSLDDRTIEMMKAQSKDELAQMTKNEEDDLTSLGHQMGIADSGWLAAQKAASKQGRDNALVASNRNIDLTAAQTRGADKRSAATLASSHSGQKASARTQAVTAAMEGALGRSSQVGTRQALQESIKQEATKLGLSADQLTQQYVVSKMEDLTRRYGIDTGAAVDYAKMALADKQFAQDLAFRLYSMDSQLGLDYSRLNQDDRQFGANYGLNLGQLEWLMNQSGQQMV